MEVTGKKVLMLCPYFEPGLEYQEVQYVRILRRMGVEVLVVATDRRAWQNSRFPHGEGEWEGATVFRVKRYLRLRETMYPLEKPKKAIADFAPDLAFIYAPTHGFPYFMMGCIPAACKVAAVFADLKPRPSIGYCYSNPTVFRLLKRRWYRKIARRADLLIAITPETEEVVLGEVGEEYADKFVMTGLIFDPESFRPDPAAAAGWPFEEQFRGKRRIVTVTRSTPDKPFSQWLPWVFDYLREKPEWVYVLAGVEEGTEPAAEIHSLVESSGLADRVLVLPMQTQEEVLQLYNACDVALWFKASIGIQKAMATGVPVVLPDHPSMAHLVEPGKNGAYFGGDISVADAIGAAAESGLDREQVTELNRRFDGERVLGDLMGRLF